jgi:exopolyphosphatase / guanosine-5'-triphosphate,3'-diphosphate pyrophosphatase
MRLGVIDCGTNTFHLLIAEAQGNGRFDVLFKQRQYVRLGEDGLTFIGQGPFQRGVACIESFKNIMAESGVARARTFGTEALRRASNTQDFIRAVQEATGVEIQLISGDEEARLIHLGVMQAVPPFLGKALIMDIGGGSVEFIICSEQEVFWAQSFPVGVQVLYSAFQKNDPISAGDLAALEWHLEQTLQPLFTALRKHQTPLLLGASGSFEVVEDFLVERKHHPLFSIVPVDDYYYLHGKMIASSLAQRKNMPKLPSERVELIVVAFVLIDFVIRKAGIRQIITSAYAMKEGILKEMMKEG